jgi:hypothetical protein
MSRVQRGKPAKQVRTPVQRQHQTVDITIDDSPCPLPKIIISGGQTGADRGGLMAGKELGIGTGGWLPNNLRVDDNIGAQVRDTYGLRESDGGYSRRDRQNADMSDCIIAFLLTKPMTGRGTTLTFQYALKGKVCEYELHPCPTDVKYAVLRGKKNVLVLWDVTEENVDEYVNVVRSFIRHEKPSNLMVSGPCERTYIGTQEAVRLLLVRSLQ